MDIELIGFTIYMWVAWLMACFAVDDSMESGERSIFSLAWPVLLVVLIVGFTKKWLFEER